MKRNLTVKKRIPTVKNLLTMSLIQRMSLQTIPQKILLIPRIQMTAVLMMKKQELSLTTASAQMNLGIQTAVTALPIPAKIHHLLTVLMQHQTAAILLTPARELTLETLS